MKRKKGGTLTERDRHSIRVEWEIYMTLYTYIHVKVHKDVGSL